MIKIIFADGTSFEAKEWNGSCVISDTELDFSDKNLKGMQIISDETITFENGKDNGIGFNARTNEYYYAFAEMTPAEIAQATQEAQILYTALMTDTLLEEE